MAYTGGLYNSVQYAFFPFDEDYSHSPTDTRVDRIDQFFSNVVAGYQEDAIVSVCMFPSAFIPNANVESDPDLNDSVTKPQCRSKTIAFPEHFNSGRIGGGVGYNPRNNKLYTFPYCYLVVDACGDARQYKYEYFGDRTIDNPARFIVSGPVSPTPEFVCVPENYNGSGSPGTYTDLEHSNYTEGISITGFPQCAFTVDSFMAYLAQKANYNGLQGAGSLASMVGGGLALLGGATGASAIASVGAIGSGGLGIGKVLEDERLARTKGDTLQGTSTNDTMIGERLKTFTFKRMSAKRQDLERLDDFFDRFGYAVNRMAIPNRSSRPVWNYIKTKDVEIEASIPVDDLAKIKSIYNNGITFWKDGNQVGNYAISNKPLGE